MNHLFDKRGHATTTLSRPDEDEARESSKHRAALEALFAKKEATPAPSDATERPSAKRIVVAARATERREADAPTQAALLDALDGADDDRARAALAALGQRLDREAPERKALLDARLRRIEDDADRDADVRALAAALRRKVRG